MNFYISDTHLGHENIIRLSKRPFTNIEEMDKTIINNWNSVVSSHDDIYIVGDLIFKTKKGYEYYLEQLNGKKHLIVGNHDTKMLKQPNIKRYFESINDLLTVNDGDYTIILCHYPLAEWNGFFRNTYHFFGHIHNNKNETYEIMKKIKKAYNVGADILNFTPKTAKQIIEGV